MSCEHWIELLNEEREKVANLQAELAQCRERLEAWQQFKLHIQAGMMKAANDAYVEAYNKLRSLGEL